MTSFFTGEELVAALEVFAGFGEYTDTEIGRLIKAIEDMGQLNNTLIFYIVSDNGASAEGGMNGMFNEMAYFNGVSETVQDVLKHYDELGGPNTYSHYAAGWAVAGDTPFCWTKQVASNYGGTSNGMVIHWPKGFKAKGEVRSQWHHVIDIAPTIMEAAGLPEPKVVDRIIPTPIEGVSMLYTLSDAKATGSPILPSSSRSSATVPYRAMVGSPVGSTRRRGNPNHGSPWKTTNGSFTTPRQTSVWQTIWPGETPRSSRRCRNCSWKRQSSTAYCP